MEYNEQAFKEKANLKAMKVWLALIAIMTLSYGSDLSKGIYTATQYVVFLVMAWVPFAIGLLTSPAWCSICSNIMLRCDSSSVPSIFSKL